MNELLGDALDVLKDVKHELGEPEIAELVSLALDRKVDTIIERLEEYFETEQRHTGNS